MSTHDDGLCLTLPVIFQLPEQIHTLHDKASLNAPYSYASRPESLQVLVASGDESALRTNTAGEDPDLLALLIETRCITFHPQIPVEVADIYLNEYCVAC